MEITIRRRWRRRGLAIVYFWSSWRPSLNPSLGSNENLHLQQRREPADGVSRTAGAVYLVGGGGYGREPAAVCALASLWGEQLDLSAAGGGIGRSWCYWGLPDES